MTDASFQPANRLHSFLDGYMGARCRILSEGDACACPRCDLDRLVALARKGAEPAGTPSPELSALTARAEQAENELAGLKRDYARLKDAYFNGGDLRLILPAEALARALQVFEVWCEQYFPHGSKPAFRDALTSAFLLSPERPTDAQTTKRDDYLRNLRESTERIGKRVARAEVWPGEPALPAPAPRESTPPKPACNAQFSDTVISGERVRCNRPDGHEGECAYHWPDPPEPIECEQCDGVGHYYHENDRHHCYRCDGWGYIPHPPRKPKAVPEPAPAPVPAATCWRCPLPEGHEEPHQDRGLLANHPTRLAIIEWLTANEFVDFEGHGYYERAYGRHYGYTTLKVGVPATQNCATLEVATGNTDERQRVYLGAVYSLAPIMAVWAALMLCDTEATPYVLQWKPPTPDAEKSHAG